MSRSDRRTASRSFRKRLTAVGVTVRRSGKPPVAAPVVRDGRTSGQLFEQPRGRLVAPVGTAIRSRLAPP
ncbi:hypothetical protein EA472_10220 [Natrarchaeobius oligotrophus]|uniref:Uncharacterized protein n=1 Tax=Natrarchaeobius chitinivorans TaxID=1679083 RepID=A0A3N6NN91_NATCH|nr:hypothetical protein EA472_10220 [Natrarchaeobius chitinivorans]